MTFSAVHKSRFPLHIDNTLISFLKRSLFWLSMSGMRLHTYQCPSLITKIRHDHFLYVHCAKHVLVFEEHRLIVSVDNSYDKVILNYDILYCFDEVLQIIHYKFVSDTKNTAIRYQKYSCNDKYLTVFDRGIITWFSLTNLKTLAVVQIQDALPVQLPSFVLNIHLLHPSYPLLLTYTYDKFYIVDIMNTIQYTQQIDCPIQHFFISQSHLMFLYTNKYICINILTMELVDLPFDIIKPEYCKSYKDDLFIVSVFGSCIILLDLRRFTTTQFQIHHPIKDICIFNNQVFYVDGSDKVYHIYNVNGEWGQDFIIIQDWILSKLIVDNNIMFLGSLTEWFIYEC